jgi:hypothetical protein
MYLSPLYLFIILLIILLISSYAKHWGLTEGFVAFNKDTTSFTSTVVPGYDKLHTIIKLYDDIYYDNKNGNSVIVSGAQFSAGTAVVPSESSGTTVSAIDIYPRKGGASARYATPATIIGAVETPIQQIVDESKIDVIESMIKEWSIYTTGKNQLNYMTWGTNTYLSVFDLLNAETIAVQGTPAIPERPAVPATPLIPATATTPEIPAVPAIPATPEIQAVPAISPSYKICLTNSYSGNATGITKSYTSIDIPIVLKTAYSYVDGTDVDKEYIEDVYDTSSNVYKFSNNVSIDVKNGNLLINTGATGKSINVYYRNHSGIIQSADVADLTVKTNIGQTEPAKKTFSSASSDPWFVQDNVNKHTIMYWPSGSNTIIASFANYFETGKGIPLVKVRRFTNKGLYTEAPTPIVPPVKDGSGNDIDDSLLDAFSRWYIYFNTNAIGSGNSSDYLLKTQIVPPVCPACPACPGGGSCNNCGGQGGSGTLSSTGSSLADIKGSSLPSIGQSSGSLISGTSSAIGATAVGAGNILNTTVDAAGNVVGKTVDTAGNIVNKTFDTAGNIVNRTVDTAGNIVNKTVDTAGNVVTNTFGTAGNLIQSAGSGVGNLLGLNNPNRFGYDQSYRGPNSGNVGSYGYVPQQTYMATSGTYNQGSAPGANVDIYSQYGALPAKGSSNYRPLTTDFSSFRR